MSDAVAGLRARLIATGVDLVASEGVQALTLREIARRAGVSHGAPRRYFATHLELLSAIAHEGFDTMAADIAAAAGDAEREPRERIRALARAYVGFAQANRGMYELMFRHDLLESGHLGLRATSLPLFDVLVDLVARARPQSGAEPRAVAGAFWANLHGLVQLWAWGSLRLATGTEDVESLLSAALDAHLGPDER